MNKSIMHDHQDDCENMEIPSEDSADCVSQFWTNTSKLLTDKGHIKAKDKERLSCKRTNQNKLSVKLPYVRWLSSNRIDKLENDWNIIRNIEENCKNINDRSIKVQQFRKSGQIKSWNWRGYSNDLINKLDVSSNVQNAVHYNPMWISRYPLNRKQQKLSNFLNDYDLGSISENSDSVSE